MNAATHGVEAEATRVSVIIPARDESARIGALVRSVLAQRPASVQLEVLVVDDNSRDATAAAAEGAGARVLRLRDAEGGNPARARNRGARAARGEVLVFLDADCEPRPGWLAALVRAVREHALVGGPFAMPATLGRTARLDYYCGWYHAHPRVEARDVRQHPPGNLCVRRELFEQTRGFVEQHPIAYAHEELAWQAQCAARGERIRLVPDAVVDHHNRPGLGNLLRRNYRWGYSALAAKAEAGNARFAPLYRHPGVLVLLAPLVAVATTPYVIACWLRAGHAEPLLHAPVIFLARCAWSAGFAVGGLRFLRARRAGPMPSHRPRWE